MKKETVDGVICWSELFTDEDSLTWNILQRSGGSISLYTTMPGVSAHAVIYDSLDGQVPSEAATKIINHLSEMAEGINVLLGKIEEGKAA